MDLGKCIKTASENIALVRKAALSMMMRIVGVSEDIQASVLGRNGYKGKYLPHFRVVAKGTFQPGDPARIDTHPEVQVKCTGIAARKNDNVLDLSPTWEITCKNYPLTYTRYELWGDEGARTTMDAHATHVEILRRQPEPT